MSNVEQWEHDEQRAMENEITSLREQVERLTKERDALRSRRCEICGYLEHEREHTGCLRVQLSALAEAKKDAERYRWLIKNAVREKNLGDRYIEFHCDFENWNNVTEAIDAAMKGK